ncbi:Uncharacterised protein [Klebsiella pneumoniae]|nr:Uncharacterised protein [Klebsiella pneumoniae]SMB59539.1 Uncharacterised protein [Klebsiella pneumoniae]VGB03476.1 Uncharacterised protein [Klebsiella pneumoniae]VGB06023.1 Uncharacterised protein [Klebsiella pneumoniae]VGG54882.1 Uncharacterised protein [Klebsiella pneumoniae]
MLGKSFGHEDTGGIHHQADIAMVSINFLTDSFHTFFGHQVRRDDRNRSQRAQFFLHRFGFVFFIPGQHDTAARFQYHACHGQAHAAGTADDEQFFTFEKSVHFLTPLLVGKTLPAA